MTTHVNPVKLPVTIFMIHEFGHPEMIAYEPVIAEGHQTVEHMMDLLIKRIKSENPGNPEVDGDTEEQFRLMMRDSFEWTVLHGTQGNITMPDPHLDAARRVKAFNSGWIAACHSLSKPVNIHAMTTAQAKYITANA